MKCPQCQETDLMMSDRQGIEIDCCPKCRGVWLDRGELDKIIQRSNQYESTLHRRDDDDDHDDERRRRYPQYDRDRYAQQPPPQPYYQKRKSFWSELFD